MNKNRIATGDAEEGSRHAERGVPSRAWRETAAAGLVALR